MKHARDQPRIFHFKQFDICDKQSAHKVGIDSILCGSWADFNDPKRILDVGTGCGLLALMMAQRFQSSQCLGIDISRNSVVEANLNFRNSPWADRLSAECSSLQAYAETNPSNQFDGIVSNPPYFRHGLVSSQPERLGARHDVSLPRNILFQCVSILLDSKGAFCLTLPSKDVEHSLSLGSNYGLHASKICTVLAVESKISKISLLRFTKIECATLFDQLIIGRQGKWTADFESLTDDFYLSA